MSEKIAKFLKLLPDTMRLVVKKHAGLLDNATVDYLEEELEAYFAQIRLKAGKNKNIDLAMIENMMSAFKHLIKLFPDFNDEEKRIVSASLKYFIDAEDARLDFEDLFGFDDDLAVLNAALLALDHEEMVVRR